MFKYVLEHQKEDQLIIIENTEHTPNLNYELSDAKHIIFTKDMNHGRYGFCLALNKELESMRFCYNKLWKLLIDRHMQKQELATLNNVSSTSLVKLAKDENVTTDILLRICEALDVELNNIVEIVRQDNGRN